MYFKRIDIQGFKSFADPVSIDFHEGITCIVGPNGSGKSNISDAVRWVLGEQSAKLLRGGKMEEVIFAGTAHHKSRGMAEVTLVIDNSRGILPIDYTEVAITRRMYRSGESGYFINQVPCRLKDIRELIMDTGIGVDGYSIIGQGRISDILSDKPEARREVFEEAAGIVKYRSKKEETERKLESSRDNLERVEDIIGEIEGRIDGLREDCIRATEYIELRDRFKELEINITLRNIEGLEQRNEKLKEDVEGTDQAIADHEQDKARLQEELNKKESRLSEIEEKAEDMRNRLLALVEEINRLSSKGRLDEERLTSLERDKTRIKEELVSLEERLIREQANDTEISKSREELFSELKGMKAQLDEKQAEMEKLEKSFDFLLSEIEDKRDRIYESHRILVEKKSEVKNARNLKIALAHRQNQLIQSREGREQSQTALTDKQRALREEHDLRVKELDSLKEEIAKLQKSYESDRELIKASIKELDKKRLHAGQTGARLKVILEMEEAYQGYNDAVKFIMKSGQKGILGAVADLIKVPAGYEKAIETALGPALQNIVCENDDDAKAAVALLKDKKAGRLTFLPLISIKSGISQNIAGLKNHEGFIGSGVDCVKFDAKFKGPVEYLLGRVVIVENLDHAVKLSKTSEAAGLRFVSLEGEVVNASGAITGGAFKSRTAGLLERKSEAESLKNELAGLEAELKSEEEHIETSEKLALEKAGRIADMDNAIKKAEMDLFTGENRLNALETEIFAMEGQRNREENELSGIEKEISLAEKSEEDLGDEIDCLEAEIAENDDRLKENQEKKTGLEKELEESRRHLSESRLDAAKIENRLAGMDESLARVRSYISENEKEIILREENLKSIEEEAKALLSGDENVGEILLQKEEEKEKINLELASLLEEKNQTGSLLAEKRAKKDTLDAGIEDLRRSKHEAELRLARNETQLEGYKERLWEDFEISYIQAIDFKKSDFVMSRALKESRETRDRIRELGEVNIGAIKEYESVKERYDFLLEQRADLVAAMESLESIIFDIDKSIKKSFTESFDQVVVNFEESFRALFGGGQAELRLADESKPLETGIDIVVQPPGKKLQNISLLSGGEKSLTAIALMFAILKTKPTPFCILDEVESALDESNIERFAKYLRSFSDIQFTLVTHQKATMEYADVLYGVTMPEGGISKLVSLKLGDDWEV